MVARAWVNIVSSKGAGVRSLVRIADSLSSPMAICRKAVKTSKTSSAFSNKMALSRLSLFGPLARGSSGEPGTAKTSCRCSPGQARRDQRSRPGRHLNHDGAKLQPGIAANAFKKPGSPI
jgi:hypothetical protein